MKKQTPDLVEFEEPKIELMYNLDKLMREKMIWIPTFIVGKKNYLLVYQNIISSGCNQSDFGIIDPGSLNRGNILNSFSKIELMLNEIIEAKILGNKEESKRELTDLSEKIDFAQKIHLFKSWGLISDETNKKLHRLRKVRNILAHSWYIENIIYGKDKTLKTNFKQFQEDLKEVWRRLINIYDFLRPQNEQLEKSLIRLKEVLAKDETKN